MCRSQHNTRHSAKPFLIIRPVMGVFDLVLIYEQEFRVAHIDQKHFMPIIISNTFGFLYLFEGQLKAERFTEV